MPYSYPFLTAKTISFIEALGMEFKTACELSNLPCRPFIITSALRTKETVNKLQKKTQMLKRRVPICMVAHLILHGQGLVTGIILTRKC